MRRSAARGQQVLCVSAMCVSVVILGSSSSPRSSISVVGLPSIVVKEVILVRAAAVALVRLVAVAAVPSW